MVYLKEISKDYNLLLQKKVKACLDWLFQHDEMWQCPNLVKKTKLSNDKIPQILYRFLKVPIITTKQRLKEDFQLTEYQYRKMMQHLYKNRWLITIGRNFTEENPFLHYLFRHDDELKTILLYYQ